jgi:hypothetical protein
MTTILARQFERCKTALIRLENALPEDATGETTVPIAAHEIDDLDVFVQNAQREIESRRSMIDETVQAIRNGNIEITKDELRAISKATANLRNALDAQPDETAGREIVLLAQKMILAALESVNERDTSWH